jgi:hypothetical protein
MKCYCVLQLYAKHITNPIKALKTNKTTILIAITILLAKLKQGY